MSQAKVVIGLPVYNGEKFVSAAIDSILSQSFTDIRLMISDNGSTDATAEICAAYAAKDSRVSYFRSPENRGILWNHRKVMEAIENPNQYFRWAGGDDIMEPGLLQTMVEILDSRPEVSAVMPDTKNIDDEGRIIGAMDRVLDIQSPDVVKRGRDILMADYQHVIAYGLMRASWMQRMRTQPDYPGWDPVFAWELALQGPLVQPAGPALLRRFHPGSISRVKTVKEMRKWVEPNAKVGLSFPNWKWAYERLRALLACPMRTGDKFHVCLFLARFTTWQRVALVRDVVQAGRRGLHLSDEYTF